MSKSAGHQVCAKEEGESEVKKRSKVSEDVGLASGYE